MILSIARSHLNFESSHLKSCVYRFKLNKFIILYSRNLHGTTLSENQIDKPMKDANEKKSLHLTWKRFHFPLSDSLFKADNVDPNEWFLIYRLKWSLKAVYTILYIQLAAFIASAIAMFRIHVQGVHIRISAINDERYHKAALTFASILISISTYFLVSAFRNLVLRGYYSPKYQRFMFIRSNVLLPWKVRKLIVAPGLPKPTPNTFSWALSPNFQIKSTKAYITEKNFFFPAYFNVMCGFSNPGGLQNIKFDPDKLFNHK